MLEIENNNNYKLNPILKIISNHYSQGSFIKSDKQNENEKYLIGSIKFNRWILFPTCVISQFIMGSIYAWSVYNKLIDKEIYGDANKGMSPNTFYVLFFFFGIFVSFTGPWIEKLGPKTSMFIGTLLFVCGHFLTALSIYVKTIWLVYIGYGAFVGVGLAWCYVVPVSTLLKWFPDHRGLASGIAVCGFGAGSIAFARIPLAIIKQVGLINNFIIISCISTFVLSITIFIVRTPPPNYIVNGYSPDSLKSEIKLQDTNSTNTINKQDEESSGSTSSSGLSTTSTPTTNTIEPKFSNYKLTDAITSTEFRLLYFMFLCNIMFGIVAIGRLSDMVQNLFGQNASMGSTIVSINGVLNLMGRISFPIITDKIGRKNGYIIILSIQMVSIPFIMHSLKSNSYIEFLIFMFLTTFSYGGGFGILPAFLSEMFGSKNLAATHGLTLSSWAIAAVVGGVSFQLILTNEQNNHGYSHTDCYPYLINYYWIVSLISIGYLLIWFIRTTEQDVFLPAIKGQIFRLNIFNRFSIRISTSRGLEYLSKYKLKLEWEEYLTNLNK